jgi:hypothetical protein
MIDDTKRTDHGREDFQSSELIHLIEKPRDNTARTDHHRATSAGTNRTYIKQADDLVKAGRTDLIEKITGPE